MTQNKMKQIRFFTIAAAIMLGIILVILILFDLNRVADKNLKLYSDNQQNMANLMVNTSVLQAQTNSKDLSDILKVEIKDNFPTSSSSYCVISKDDKILFLKDENTSSTLGDQTLSALFNYNQISSRDQKKYLISSSEVQYNGSLYTLTICARENYLIAKMNLTEVKLHCIGYFVIYAMILVIIIIFSFYLLRTRENKIRILENDIKTSRMILEKLENDKKKNYTNSENEDVYSFYNRNIVEEVIAGMSLEDKSNCIQIDITVENLKMEHFVLITAILVRIKEGKSIACYWEENQFKVLLFESTNEEVQGFIDLFINKYKSETEEKVEELKIIASRFLD